MSQRGNIFMMRVSNHKQENFLLYIYTVYYFTTITSQTKYWKPIQYLNPLEPKFVKIILKNSIPTIQNTNITLL
jgi:hypothetical protein